ncbi:MAG: murein L,D-transpeptidase YcbB/YkuD [Janthinobacterium sp.]|jgi:murein L,D-transpeptidase YcbB/YkuD
MQPVTSGLVQFVGLVQGRQGQSLPALPLRCLLRCLFGSLLVACLCAWVSPAQANNVAFWFSAGRPTAQALEAVQILEDAALDGLNPDDYSASGLAQAFTQGLTQEQTKADAGPFSTTQQALLGAALSTALERFVADLHSGRVAPKDIHAAFAAPQPMDPPAYIGAALAGQRLGAAIRAQAPQLPLYAHLRRALAQYRQLALDATLAQPLPPLPAGSGNKVAPGQAWVGIAALAQKLLALGDMADLGAADVPARYEGALVDGVKAFQLRHALLTDGIIGRATLAQLNVPPAARVRQIELALERLRWTPLLLAPRMIVVNVPEFVLRAYEVEDGRIEVKATMNVIVGKAQDTRTPLFIHDMRMIEFSPYWNIPPSIAKAETVPRLSTDPAYFEQEGLEFVDPAGQVSRTLTQAGLAEVLGGQSRIRQRPGPRNALGDIKFIFPNSDNIYLHHTSTPRLFVQDRRDLSHGCVRVEDPVALARFVLQAQPQWSTERIRAAMERRISKTIRVAPLPVVIAYITSRVNDDGKVYFFQDIYGHDRLLDAALRAKAGRAAERMARDGGA